MSNKQWMIIIIVLAALAAAYAITLQLTGQQAMAEKFVEWAGGGIGFFLVWMLLFGA